METVYKLTTAEGYTRKGMKGETLWSVGIPSVVLSGGECCGVVGEWCGVCGVGGVGGLGDARIRRRHVPSANGAPRTHEDEPPYSGHGRRAAQNGCGDRCGPQVVPRRPLRRLHERTG